MRIYQVVCKGRDCDWRLRWHDVGRPFLKEPSALARAAELRARDAALPADVDTYYGEQTHEVRIIDVDES